MNASISLTSQLDAATIALIERAAQRHGVSREEYVADAARNAAEREAELDEMLEAGAASIARGDYVEHDSFVANMRDWRETRRRPA